MFILVNYYIGFFELLYRVTYVFYDSSHSVDMIMVIKIFLVSRAKIVSEENLIYVVNLVVKLRERLVYLLFGYFDFSGYSDKIYKSKG